MVFSTKLTEEERFLKKQYQTLKELKKELKQLTLKRKQEETATNESGPTSAKQKKAIIKGNKTPTAKSSEFSSGGPNYNVRIVTSVDAAANTEAAKRLLKSGAIQLKVENKTTFKRSSNLKRKLNDAEPRRKPMFQALNTESESTEEEIQEKEEPVQVKKTFAAVPPPKATFKPADNNLATKRGRKIEKKAPKRGNTIYVYGFVLTQKVVEDHFTKFGNIVDVNLERGKSSGFVSYDTFEAAEKAIHDMNDVMVQGCRLKVSLARKQPMLRSVVSGTDWSGLVSRDDKGYSAKDNRSLVRYDDDVIDFDS